MRLRYTVSAAALVLSARGAATQSVSRPGGNSLGTVRPETLAVNGGALVRFLLGPSQPWQRATFAGQRADTILLTTCAACAPQPVALRSIDAIEVHASRAVSGSRIVRGTLLGAGIGTVIGLVLIQSHIHSQRHCDGCGLAILALPEFALGGAAGGAVMGALIRPEQWQPVQLPPRPAVLSQQP